VGVFGCTQDSPSFKPNSEPDGFAGIKWGTEFTLVKSDMVESRSEGDPTEPDVKIKIYYTRKGDNLRTGEAQLDKIEYGFRRGKFAEVQIAAIGSENYDHLKKVLFEKYGSVDKPFQGVCAWNGSVTQMFLRYDEATKTSSLTIASTRITSQAIRELVDKD
jgi:hypothetical protein